MPTPSEFRQMMGRFATGVSVVLLDRNGDADGLTVNSLTSVSLNPQLILFCLKNESRHFGEFVEGRKFTVNVLAEQQHAISRHFAGKPNEDLTIATTVRSGFRWLQGTLATVFCEVEGTLPGGDHTIILGRVIDLSVSEDLCRPLIFHAGRYASLATELGC